MEISIKTNYIYHGDCLEILKTFPDNCIQCCVTSPPYWGLRDYQTAIWEGGKENCDHIESFNKHKGERKDRDQEGYKKQYKNICKKCGAIRIDKQIGLEKTPEEYVEKLVEVFNEVKRVLKDDGTLWLNLGDTYMSSGSSTRHYGYIDPIYQQGRKIKFDEPQSYPHPIIKPKDLVGIPWMVVFALRNNGWFLRQDIIWNKINCLPESVKDRCVKSHEYVFLLSKNSKYYFDYKAIQEPANYDGRKDILHKGGTKYMNLILPNFKTSTLTYREHKRWNQDEDGNYVRNKRSVWSVPTQPLKNKHYATFPEKLIEPMILAGCPKDGIVLDPFFGSGTVGVVCVNNMRQYIGIDLKLEYIDDIAKERIKSCYGIFH